MIKACIFDLGGTIVDRYSLSPFLSLRKVFSNNCINIRDELIFKDMGKSKKEHIYEILSDSDVKKQWSNINNCNPKKNDVNKLFDQFNEIQIENSKKMITILPETKNCIDFLRKNNIKTGTTTGFNKENMEIIKSKLENSNIFIDSYVSSTCLNKPSRPRPFMIQKNLENLNIRDPNQVIKLDDTIIGIEEGLNAGCITVGVARWSINMGIYDISDSFKKKDYELKNNLKKSREVLESSGAHYVINTLDELPTLINILNLNKDIT